MITLYFILLTGTFLIGYMDNKNITAFVIIAIFGAVYFVEEIKEKRKNKNEKAKFKRLRETQKRNARKHNKYIQRSRNRGIA